MSAEPRNHAQGWVLSAAGVVRPRRLSPERERGDGVAQSDASVEAKSIDGSRDGQDVKEKSAESRICGKPVSNVRS